MAAVSSNPDFDSGILDVFSPKKCSCQELLKTSNVSLSGWLRKKCLRNRLSVKIFKWPQVYIVICDTCLYYFNSEMSKKPSGSVSLYGFNRIIRSTQSHKNDPPWALKLEHVQPNIPSLYFSASSEKEMVKWMRVIKQEMLVANHKAPNSSTTSTYLPQSSDGSSAVSEESFGSSDYNDIEASIYIEPLESDCSVRMSMASNYSVAELDDGHEEDLDDFSEDEFAEEREAANVALATVLKGNAFKTKPAQPLPEAEHPCEDGYDLQKELPTKPPKEDYWSSVHFAGNRTEAGRVIETIAEDGVYLVRKSDGDSKVLVAYATGCRKYKVFNSDEGKVYLQSNGPQFDNLEQMLYHYCSNALPNTDICLSTPYKLHPRYDWI